MNDLEKKDEVKLNNLIKPSDSFDNAVVGNAVKEVEGKIVEKAVSKVNDEKIIEKHSKKLAEISDKAIEAETERQELVVESRKADNKVQRQEIKNRLIELKTETIRLKREKKQTLKEQKDDHKKRNKDILWGLYEKKLAKMGYGYVPNLFILKMLLMIDGIVSFFDGIGKISTSIMKALKWIFIIGGIVGVLMIVPASREWLLTLLKFK